MSSQNRIMLYRKLKNKLVKCVFWGFCLKHGNKIKKKRKLCEKIIHIEFFMPQ